MSIAVLSWRDRGFVLQEWLESGGVEVEGNPAVARELGEFLSRVAQCGAPYQQWCEELRHHWNINVSTV